FVPLDGRLLDSIERTSDAHAGIAIALARGGTLVVAPGLLQDARLAVRDGSPADATIAGAQYRTAAMTVVGGRPPTQLVALVPQPLVDSGSDRRRRVIVAVVATAATAGLLLLTLQLVRGRRRTRTGSRDRRRSLGPRSMSIGREGGRDALALVGDALAATHDPEALLPVILGAAIEATGATGGRLVAGSRELAVRGTSANDGGSLVVPLGNGDDTGSLVLFPPATGFSLEARELARWLAAQASIALENARLHGLVKAQAVTDELTGLSNRRRFMEVLELELKRSDRFESPLALVLADLDDFKLVNDRFGHQTGDDVLRALSGVLRASLRADVDLPARLGGEEFAVLLPETDALGAQGLAERLREELAALELQGPGEQLLSVTASFGVAVYPDAASGDELLTLADAALYAAKAAGKNRVVIAPNGA
ncbi:MAG TPA: GGDEF domain-containing protein, partial [Gaiellaceae bacterium]